jgi:hypothetical protein
MDDGRKVSVFLEGDQHDPASLAPRTSTFQEWLFLQLIPVDTEAS